MSKHQERINIINLLYRYFILQHDIVKNKQEFYDFCQVASTSFESIIIKKILTNLSNIITNINQYLKSGWNFDRLSNYHKAILVYGVYEICYQKLAKAIVINESLEILKRFGEDTNFSYINSILDQVK